jgi:hypothetical protein
MLAITDRDVCTSCAALFISPETEAAAQNAAPPEINPFQQTPQAAGSAPVYPAPGNNYVPQNLPPRSGFGNSLQTSPPVMDARCMRCRTIIARGESRCFDCANKKSSPFKRLAVAAVLVAVIGFFSFDYVYEQVSPHGIFRKYAKTTGADDSIVFDNFVLTGETYVSVDSSADSFKPNRVLEDKHSLEDFSFKMVFKKPSLSSVEFMRDGGSGSHTAFKQVFDGTRGWKYMNMPNQPAGYQDTDDAFASKKLGMGMDEYDSLEFMNEAAAQEYGKDNIKALTDIKEIEAADIKKPSGEKVIVLGKQKLNGKIDSSLLVFDQQTGLLLGILKKAVTNNNMPVITIIYLNKYAKFPVKRKGLFGVEETRILVPTKMSFVTKPGDSGKVSGMPVIMIELNIKAVEINAAIEDSYFTR